MSDFLQPHGLQPTRLLRPWDFPGKSTGVGCHCLLWCMSHFNAKFTNRKMNRSVKILQNLALSIPSVRTIPYHVLCPLCLTLIFGMYSRSGLNHGSLVELSDLFLSRGLSAAIKPLSLLTGWIFCLFLKPGSGSEFSTSVVETMIHPELQTRDLEDALNSTLRIIN